MQDTPSREWMLIAGGVFEAGIGLMALWLGWWFDVNPLRSLVFGPVAVAWGLGGAAVLFLLLLISDRFKLPQFRVIKKLLIELLGEALSNCRAYEIVLLAVVVGFCEELMFRGLLQPWIEQSAGYAHGLFWSNVIFGLVHCATLAYGILAGITGMFLGWLMDASGERNLLAPMITHGVYDYLAFLWVVRAYRQQHEQQSRAL